VRPAQTAIGKELGVPQNTISRWLSQNNGKATQAIMANIGDFSQNGLSTATHPHYLVVCEGEEITKVKPDRVGSKGQGFITTFLFRGNGLLFLPRDIILICNSSSSLISHNIIQFPLPLPNHLSFIIQTPTAKATRPANRCTATYSQLPAHYRLGKTGRTGSQPAPAG